jgi:hypothetical protein
VAAVPTADYVNSERQLLTSSSETAPCRPATTIFAASDSPKQHRAQCRGRFRKFLVDAQTGVGRSNVYFLHVLSMGAT